MSGAHGRTTLPSCARWGTQTRWRWQSWWRGGPRTIIPVSASWRVEPAEWQLRTAAGRGGVFLVAGCRACDLCRALAGAEVPGTAKALVADAYREGAVAVLCTTTTLSSSVNLPAFRVVFRQAWVATKGNWLTPQQ